MSLQLLPYLLPVGCFFLIAGGVLLYNFWWKLSFDIEFTTNMNTPTFLALLLFCCVVIWIGQWLLLCGLGLAPFELPFRHKAATYMTELSGAARKIPDPDSAMAALTDIETALASAKEPQP